MAEKVRVRYLGGEKPTQGRWGFETFTIDGDTAHVTPQTAQAMVTEQPKLWAYVKDAEARKAEDRAEKDSERLAKDLKTASESVSKQVPHDVTTAPQTEGGRR